MGADARHQGTRLRRAEPAREHRHRRERRDGEPREADRMARELGGSQGADERVDDEVPLGDQRLYPASISRRVLPVPKAGDGGADPSMEQRRRPVVERVGHLHRRLDPFQAVALEPEPGEDRRRAGHRVDGAADIVDDARERQLRGSAATAERLGRLDQADRPAGTREHDGCGETVRPAADDDGVE